MDRSRETTAGCADQRDERPRRLGTPLLYILIALALLLIVTQRAGHIWGDDFAEHILQTKHMATGHGFIPYEYIPNPDTQLGGQAYPPMLSLLLLPVYLLFGLNLTAMKMVEVVCYIAAMFLVDRVFVDRLPAGWRLMLVALVALNPILFNLRDTIDNHVPFLFVFLLTLYILQKAYQGTPDRRPGWRTALLTGAAILAACATRNVGYAFFPAVVILDLISYRRLTAFAVTSCAVAAAPALLLARLLDTTSGYAKYYNFSPKWIVYSGLTFAKSTEQLWWNGFPRFIAYAAALLAGALAARGFWLCLRRGPGPLEAIVPCYLGIVLPYFAPGYSYYLLPLLPLYMGYILIAIRDGLMRRTRPSGVPDGGLHWLRTAVYTAGIAAVVFLYGGNFARANWGPIREGIADPEFIRLCDFIKSNTDPSDVMLFRKPRLLALMTGRTSSVYTIHDDRPTPPAEIWTYAGKVHARYLIIPLLANSDLNVLNRDLEQFVSGYADHLKLAYSSDHYHMYKIS